MARIIRVYGKADSFDIELTREGGHWIVDVPPDLVDGVYAVQLTAVNEFNQVGHWVGELFMCNGVCRIKFSEIPYEFTILSDSDGYSSACRLDISVKEYEAEFTENYRVELKKKLNRSMYPVQFIVSKYYMTIERECTHGK